MKILWHIKERSQNSRVDLQFGTDEYLGARWRKMARSSIARRKAWVSPLHHQGSDRECSHSLLVGSENPWPSRLATQMLASSNELSVEWVPPAKTKMAGPIGRADLRP